MMKALKKNANYRDLYDVPENFVAEILGGELYAFPRPRLDLRGLSPSTARIDRAKKLAIYARESVRYAWLVDPLQQTLEVLDLESARWTVLATHEADQRVRAEPFEAIELDLDSLWSP